ncbi:MAG: hypothetical protein EOP09_04920 [Proteobacteria bacterium]|nr:MAG: hypothetical protein EOP09_04920 [Pseudomonadota bacterium]
MSYLMIDELTQEYQDTKYAKRFSCVPSSVGSRPSWNTCTGNGFLDQAFLEQNTRFRLKSTALEMSLGFQFATGVWSVGVNARNRSMITDELEYSIDKRTNFGGFQELDGTGAAFVNAIVTPLVAEVGESKIKDPLKRLPTEVRAGIAWFPSSTLLWTFDTIHNTKAEGGQSIYDREAVTNFATGAEYYITPSIPLRAGFFTNYDARPEVESGKSGQADHIDYMGYSVFGGWVQPNSQIAAGVILQTGDGKAQKTGDANIQSVEALSYTLAVSATHSF